MARISDANLGVFNDFHGKVQGQLGRMGSFEEAAQQYVSTLYEDFTESVVLARLFATVPCKDLPAENKTFVESLARSKGVSASLREETLVLSLLGTAGEKAEWRDRRNSRGHVGIPLVSSAFIDAIPMMSRLLRQLGLKLEWIDEADTEVVKHTMGSLSGVFFVPDAALETDSRGRKIIAAQDFVTRFGVKSVLGFGGAYVGTPTFMVTIVFLREAIDQQQARQFAAGMSFFKAATTNLVRKKIFT